MQTTIIGYPRIGKKRELKFAIEKYWKGEISEAALLETAQTLRNDYTQTQIKAGLSAVPCNDFSFYDNMLDVTTMLGAIPARYKALNLSQLDTYFAMARGYQGKNGDVTALSMKKWFNTNYHYMVSELDKDTKIEPNFTTLFSRVAECSTAVSAASNTTTDIRPVIIGPFTFLHLAHYKDGKTKKDFAESVGKAYIQLVTECNQKHINWLQFDEPALVTDLSEDDKALFISLYKGILGARNGTKILLQTYFGDLREILPEIVQAGFDGVGLDFIEGKKTLELLKQNPLSANTILFVGIVNGKNIWKCNYQNALKLINTLLHIPGRTKENTVLSTSCSLLHVPYSVAAEKDKLDSDVIKRLSFAEEKLTELTELARLANLDCAEYEKDSVFARNQNDCTVAQVSQDNAVQKRTEALREDDFIRGGKNGMKRPDRQKLQRKRFSLPLLPTTTIGSFPQTAEVKHNRTLLRKGEITKTEYNTKVFSFIKECIQEQEKIGLDILVHGEYERNDMVEFFGENLAGFVFTSLGWVQSYGTRCVKPPIIAGDVKRTKSITVPYSVYAASLTKKPVKGMLTGPVTILNWSFPREDIPLKQSAFQIALAIRDEVLDLEKEGISIIQIDEAALREKLPLRRTDWQTEYLDWAIPAFRLCHSGVKNETQIHTHMCYSEFEDIISAIDNMDADVITFEASRSKLMILDALKEAKFETETGPGVYDIHSPRVPTVNEITEALRTMLRKISAEKLWVNPDCGLKTRGTEETTKSLINLVEAAKIVRSELKTK